MSQSSMNAGLARRAALLAAVDAAIQGEPDAAARLAREVAISATDAPDLVIARAELLFALGHPGQALPGELLLWLGRYPEARADFERALARDAYTRWAGIGLAATHLGEGRLAEGLALLDACEKCDLSGPGPTSSCTVGRLSGGSAGWRRRGQPWPPPWRPSRAASRHG